jgi:DNA polymerase III delta prime subunit
MEGPDIGRPRRVAVTILVAMRYLRRDGRLPVLWLYGPPGVGKTTVGWQLFTQLTRDGTPTGYVDIDQLGMCYAAPTPDEWAPEPASDPGRYRMKARNLDAVVTNFQAAGAQCLIVSGVVDADRGFDAGLVPHAALTACRLRCEPGDLRTRLAGRARLGDDQPDGALRHAEALEGNDTTGVCVDTTRRSVSEVLQLVRERTGGWPLLTGQAGTPTSTAAVRPEPDDSTGEILWLCGATAVGKSTVGWRVYERVRRAGFRAAFVDLQQIGFHRPVPAADPGNHQLKAANLAALWRNYRASGARCMVVVGPVDCLEAVRTYTAALPAATITLGRLHANKEQLAERISLRGRGLGSWDIPGDELKGRSAAHLQQVADRAAAEAEALESASIGDLRIDTDDRPVPDLVDEIIGRTGWPVEKVVNH